MSPGFKSLIALSHLPFVRQTRLELFACVLGVLDVDELLMDGCRIIKRGLSASIYTGHRRPNTHGASEVIGYIHRHHVLDTQAKVCRAFDLRIKDEDKKVSQYIASYTNDVSVVGFKRVSLG